LLIAYILPVCSLFAPGRAGASTLTATNVFLTGPLVLRDSVRFGRRGAL